MRGPLGSNSFILIDAIELRRRGVELLSPVLVPYGFVYQAGEVDRGSGGLYAHGGSHERTATDLVRFDLSSSPAAPRSLQRLSRKSSVPVGRPGLPRSSLAITLLGWAWAHLRRDRRGTLRP
jgi:hypothetical protein